MSSNIKQQLTDAPPLLVYQMGKVGSEALYQSLAQAAIPYTLYHVHRLTHSGIQQTKEDIQRVAARISPQGARPLHLEHSEQLRAALDDDQESHTWKVITLVREPVRRHISDLFQNMRLFHPDHISQDGVINTERVLRTLREYFALFDESHDTASTWFDEELKATMGIDVFAIPFDHDNGYAITRHDNAHVLVIRLEDLDRVYRTALSSFLECDFGHALVDANRSEDKYYGEAYSDVLQRLKLPRVVCDKIYATRFVRHFYGEDEIALFYKRWVDEN